MIGFFGVLIVEAVRRAQSSANVSPSSFLCFRF
jgi:hypothetical protein